ncbi:MAG: aldehyde dehydrogenase family protein, partial [Thermoleophilaceae bacterium]|nr:aldehyde dehydrogenase family protein [Thermoleophilaceae bacterium]
RGRLGGLRRDRARQRRPRDPFDRVAQRSLVLKEPLGVVGAIVPWNYPSLGREGFEALQTEIAAKEWWYPYGADEGLPPDHVRLPDERARLRADEGNARLAGLP